MESGLDHTPCRSDFAIGRYHTRISPGSEIVSPAALMYSMSFRYAHSRVFMRARRQHLAICAIAGPQLRRSAWKKRMQTASHGSGSGSARVSTHRAGITQQGKVVRSVPGATVRGGARGSKACGQRPRFRWHNQLSACEWTRMRATEGL